MRRRLQFLLFLLLIGGVIKAQSIEALTDTKKNAFRLNPISYLFAGEYNASFEKRFGEKYGIQLGLGSIWYDWIIPGLGEDQEVTPWPADGFVIRLDLKGYLPELLSNIPVANYVAIQLLYKHIEVEHVLRVYQNYADRADIKKDVGGLKLLLGRQMDAPGALLMNIYTGIGIRYRKQQEHIFWQRWRDQDTFTYNVEAVDKNQSWVYPTIHLGLDIGFEF